MKKIWQWLLKSNRWKHGVGGILIGFLADCDFCAVYIGTCVAAVLELKDKSWGGKWDWIDFGITVLGSVVGRLIRVIL